MEIKLRSQLIKGALIAFIAFILGSTAAQALPNQTWVSGVGDDTNPCSRTLPCKTFAGAIGKTASGGEISVLDPGSFGPVTITQSITLNGDGTLASVSGVGSSGTIVINGANIVVNLRSLSIDGGGSAPRGVNIVNAGTVNIEHCVITEIGGIIGDGIGITQAAEVNVENCSIIGNNGFGVNIAPTVLCGVTIKNTTIRKCASGAVYAHPNSATGAAVNISKSSLNDSRFGFRADDNVKAVLDDCVLAGNANNGVTVTPASVATKVTVSRCTINDTGGNGIISSGAAATVFLSNSVIFNNVTGILAPSGGTLNTLGNNNIQGNSTNGSASANIGTQ
jgi:hypothetical protein